MWFSLPLVVAGRHRLKKGLTTGVIFAINFKHIRSHNLFGGNPNLVFKLPLKRD
jgi:hypothetical protein